MKKIILAESRRMFTHDLETHLMIDARQLAVTVTDGIDEALARYQPGAELVISESVLDESAVNLMQRIPAGAVIYGYCQTSNGIFEFSKYQIPCIGVLTKPDTLLKAIETTPVTTLAPVNVPQQTQSPVSPSQIPFTDPKAESHQMYQPPPQPPIQAAQPAYQPMPQQPMPQPQQPVQSTQQPVAMPAMQQPMMQQPATQQPTAQTNDQLTQMMQLMQTTQDPVQKQMIQQMILQMMQTQQPVAQPAQQAYMPQQVYAPPSMGPSIEAQQMLSGIAENAANAAQTGNYVVTDTMGNVTPVSNEVSTRDYIQQKALVNAEYELAKEKMSVDRKTKVISVYSPKGGVGKTTISTSLATYLALTVSGRGRLRVCILDYNIDFGNVCSLLNLSHDKANMSYWAGDIREQIGKRQSDGSYIYNQSDVDNMRYSRADMEGTWLQRCEETGLYALLAPTTHADSMALYEEELEIMISSVIENGEFDFVICDTGNNTRDSTTLALEMSDIILMIVTQDVTTVDSCASFITACEMIELDLNKVRLVINKLVSSRATGISIDDIEKSMPYECIARIKNEDDVTYANNQGVPLVRNEKHPYTKQISDIANYIAGEKEKKTVLESPKKGFFGRKSK